MKRVLLGATAIALSLGVSIAADTPDPAVLPGGLSGNNVIHDSNSTFNGQTITSTLGNLNTAAEDAQATANAAIPKTQINVADGVAGLDSSGSVTANVLTQQGQFGPSISGATVPLLDAYVTGEAIGGGYEYTGIGGHALNLAHSSYGTYAAQPGSLNIVSAPSGPYNAGCTICAFSEPAIGRLAAISGIDYRTGASSTHDGVMFYENPVNAGARLILPVASYTATSVVLSTALTDEEVSQLKPGEYIITNSVPAGTTQTPVGTSGTLPGFYNISGYIQSVSDDHKTINVYGWGMEDGTRDLTPTTTSLDTVWDPNRTTPVVYAGALTKLFKENTYMVYDGSRGGQGSDVGTSLIHNQELGEYDFQVSNLNRDYEVSQHGYTFTSDASSSTQLTDDSYFLNLAGGMRTYITMSPQWWTIPIKSDPLYVGSLEGAAYTAGSQKVITSWAQSTENGDNSFSNFHYIRPQIWTTRNSSDSTAYNDTTVSFGVGIDGTVGATNAIQERIDFNPVKYPNGVSLCGYSVCGLSVDGSGNSHADGNLTVTGTTNLGTYMTIDASGYAGNYSPVVVGAPPSGYTAAVQVAAQSGFGNDFIEFFNGSTEAAKIDYAGNLTLSGRASVGGSLTVGGDINLASGKSVYFCDSSSRCSYLHSTQYANAKISPYSGNYGGAYVAGSFTLNSLPTDDDDGAQVWCSDCKLNSVTGVAAYWHASASKWTDSQNNTLTN